MKLLIIFFLVSMPCLALSLEYQTSPADKPVILHSKNVELQVFQQRFNWEHGSIAVHTVYSNIDEVKNFSSDVQGRKQQSFYFQSQLTIHKSENLNIAMTANFTQKNSSHIGLPSNNASQNFHLIEDKKNNHYGLMGSYLVTPSWQVSGGFLYSISPTENAYHTDTEDNIALIGTTYSF